MLAIHALVACAHGPAAPPKPSPIALRFEAGLRLNPDEQGRSLPTTVQVLQVSSTGKAASADLLELTRDPKALLGDDLLGVVEVSLEPQGRLERQVAREAGARFLIVAGIFRRPTALTWRELVELPGEGEPVSLSFRVEDYRVERRVAP